MLKLVLSELQAAENADVPKLPHILTVAPEKVFVRDLWLDAVWCLSDYVRGPFSVVDEDGHFVFYGTKKENGRPAKLRIQNNPNQPTVLQYCDEKYQEWGDSPFSYILLLPKEYPSMAIN